MDKILKQRLAAVLASYGADPARWPTAERGALPPHLEAGDGLIEAARIDRLLGLASRPTIPAGLESRLMARVAEDVRLSVLPFVRPAPRWSLAWTVALPLAASLALGIYLGAAGSFDPFLPPVVTGDVAAADDDGGGDPSGVSEATDYSTDQVS
jgi:hypothetical protein